MNDNPYRSPESSDASTARNNGFKDRLLAGIVYFVLAGMLLILAGMGLIALFIFALGSSNM